MKWQRRTRLVIAVMAVIFAVGVGLTMRQRGQTAPPPSLIPRSDEKALFETMGGNGIRLNKNREEVRIDYQKMLTYQDGSNKMMGIKVTTVREDRTFVITGAEGALGQSESTVEVSGNVHVTVCTGEVKPDLTCAANPADRLVIITDRATYTDADGIARAAGPVEFTRGDRMNGTGVGFTYDKNQDILTLLDQAVVHIAADEKGQGAMDVNSGAMEFRRNEHSLRFDRTMKAVRPKEIIEADTAVAHLTSDEKHLDSVELRGQSKITTSGSGAGGLQALTGRDIDLKYGAGTETIDHALINGDAVIQLAGDGTQPGRQITAASVDVSLAPDGVTPIALTARENVRLSLPAEQNGVGRNITSQTLEAKGDDAQGLTTAHITGNVLFSEHGPDVNRSAHSTLLDVALKPGFASIDDARFAHAVRFVDEPMTATAAAARYVLDDGSLELSGSEPGSVMPHVVNDQIMIDAARIDVTLDGPVVNAVGAVKSILQPQSKEPGKKRDIKMPSMLKQDQPVNVTADRLNYAGSESRATYEGGVQLWQGETLIKSPNTLVIDSQKGDLSATGPVTTFSVLLQEAKDGTKERVRSVGTAATFAYQDSDRRATYTGDAHMSGPQGDLTAQKIELFLKPSGDELERVEAYETVSLRSETQKTTGNRLTYFGEDNRYLVNGSPVTIIDNCGQETTGRALTFFKTTDRIVVDGKEGVRTHTKGKSNCPGT